MLVQIYQYWYRQKYWLGTYIGIGIGWTHICATLAPSSNDTLERFAFPLFIKPRSSDIHNEQADIFDIDTRVSTEDEDKGQEMISWQQRTECNWATGGWTRSSLLAASEGQTSPTQNLSSVVSIEEVRTRTMTSSMARD